MQGIVYSREDSSKPSCLCWQDVVEDIPILIPYMTTMAAAKAAALGVATMRSIGGSGVNALQDIHASIK